MIIKITCQSQSVMNVLWSLKTLKVHVLVSNVGVCLFKQFSDVKLSNEYKEIAW